MKRAGVVAGAVMLLTAALAPAQYMQPYGGTLANPYVNLLGSAGGNFNPAITYMGIVQPQLQAQAMFQQMQGQIDLTRRMPGGVAPPSNRGISDTGYAPARYMQYQQYFNTMFNGRRATYQTQPGMNMAPYGGR